MTRWETRYEIYFVFLTFINYESTPIAMQPRVARVFITSWTATASARAWNCLQSNPQPHHASPVRVENNWDVRANRMANAKLILCHALFALRRLESELYPLAKLWVRVSWRGATLFVASWQVHVDTYLHSATHFTERRVGEMNAYKWNAQHLILCWRIIIISENYGCYVIHGVDLLYSELLRISRIGEHTECSIFSSQPAWHRLREAEHFMNFVKMIPNQEEIFSVAWNLPKIVRLCLLCSVVDFQITTFNCLVRIRNSFQSTPTSTM